MVEFQMSHIIQSTPKHHRDPILGQIQKLVKLNILLNGWPNTNWTGYESETKKVAATFFFPSKPLVYQPLLRHPMPFLTSGQDPAPSPLALRQPTAVG